LNSYQEVKNTHGRVTDDKFVSIGKGIFFKGWLRL